MGIYWRWSKERAELAIKNGTLRPKPGSGKPEYFIPASTYILRDNFYGMISQHILLNMATQLRRRNPY